MKTVYYCGCSDITTCREHMTCLCNPGSHLPGHKYSGCAASDCEGPDSGKAKPLTSEARKQAIRVAMHVFEKYPIFKLEASEHDGEGEAIVVLTNMARSDMQKLDALGFTYHIANNCWRLPS